MMINPHRDWNINLTKETLLKEIDDEIQKEYLEINKFSSEKFSILLVIFGVLTIIVMIWPSNFPWSVGLSLYLLASSVLFAVWTYGEGVKNWLKRLLRISNVDQGADIEIKQPNLLKIFNLNERDQLKLLLNTDWQFVKKGEPHFRAFAIFLCTIVLICYANIQRWICVPHLSDYFIFGITIGHLLIGYSLIIIVSMYNPDINTRFWEILFDFLKLIDEKKLSYDWIISNGIAFIILGVFLILFWGIFFKILPIVLLFGLFIPIFH